jgi:DNA-binding GntR family transcriptional regulator
MARASKPETDRSAGEMVARELGAQISDGRLKPGASLRQERLARDFGVSRIPVRQALHQLEIEGLVEIRPNCGARVAVLDFQECIAVYKIRERLEPLALSESIEHLSETQVEIVARREGELDQITDPQAWIEGDRRFHLATYAGVQSPQLLRIIVNIWNTTQHYRRLLLSTFKTEQFDVVRSEHRLILDAIRHRNVRFAEEFMRLHMERARRRLEQHRHLFEQTQRPAHPHKVQVGVIETPDVIAVPGGGTSVLGSSEGPLSKEEDASNDRG